MTKLLKQAVEKASALAKPDQDAIAQLVLDEIKSEKKWQSLFAKSPKLLRKLADQAKADFENGRTEELDPEEL